VPVSAGRLGPNRATTTTRGRQDGSSTTHSRLHDGDRRFSTAREREVLTLVVAGYTNKDLAQKLSISEDTVKHHLTSIFDKTGVSNRLELALFAIHHRFVANP